MKIVALLACLMSTSVLNACRTSARKGVSTEESAKTGKISLTGFASAPKSASDYVPGLSPSSAKNYVYLVTNDRHQYQIDLSNMQLRPSDLDAKTITVTGTQGSDSIVRAVNISIMEEITVSGVGRVAKSASSVLHDGPVTLNYYIDDVENTGKRFLIHLAHNATYSGGVSIANWDNSHIQVTGSVIAANEINARLVQVPGTLTPPSSDESESGACIRKCNGGVFKCAELARADKCNSGTFQGATPACGVDSGIEFKEGQTCEQASGGSGACVYMCNGGVFKCLDTGSGQRCDNSRFSGAVPACGTSSIEFLPGMTCSEMGH